MAVFISKLSVFFREVHSVNTYETKDKPQYEIGRTGEAPMDSHYVKREIIDYHRLLAGCAHILRPFLTIILLVMIIFT